MRSNWQDKFKTRDIVINHIDSIYCNEIMHLKELKEILTKLKELNRLKHRTTSISARKDLHMLQFKPDKETAAEFSDKIEEKVRIFVSVLEAGVISEKEKRDYFFQSVVGVVPEVHIADYVFKGTAFKEMN